MCAPDVFGALTRQPRAARRGEVINVLVTGATGFLGSFIAERCSGAGHQVTCTVRPTSNLRWLAELPIDKVTCSLERRGEVEQVLAGKDAVIHAAGVTRARKAQTFFDVNTRATRLLAEAAVHAGVRRFVLVSSLAARGPDQAASAVDPSDAASSDNGGDNPTSHYGRSKLAAEHELARYADRVETVVLRPAGVYGPRDSDFLTLFGMVRRGWLVVPRRRPVIQLLYVEDAADAALAALTAAPPGCPLPLAEPRAYSQAEFLAALSEAVGATARMIALPSWLFAAAGGASELLSSLTGRPALLDRRRAVDAAVYTWTCETYRAENALGWQATINLADGLKRTASWYRQAGWL